MRWTPAMKLRVLEAAKLVGEEHAAAAFGISPEEFAEWKRNVERFGRVGAFVTKSAIARRFAAKRPRTTGGGGRGV